MTANPQRIPAISAYPDGTGWRVHVDMPGEIIADLNLRAYVDGKGDTREQAIADVVKKLTNVAIHALQQVNHLTKAQ